MSREIILAQKPAVDRSFALMEEFVNVCPDDVWTKKNGQWPVWQEIYHCATAVKFFTGLDEGIEKLASDEVSSLVVTGTETPSKAQIKAGLKAAQATVEKYLEKLTDADLTKRNEAVFAARQWDISHAFTLATLATHNFYHLGSCDTALRHAGLKGVF